MQKREVVITGIGVVSPLGLTLKQSWDALLAGHSGIARITHFDPAPFNAQVAGEVKGFDPETTGLHPKDLKRADRFIQLGLAAAREAMSQAGLLGLKDMDAETRQRVATIVGTGIGGLDSTERAVTTLATEGPRRLSPFFIPAMLPNLLAGQISMMYGAQGANVCPVSACATSAHALGWGKRLIEWGEADIVIAGGSEAAVTASALGGFAAMRALSTSFNENPEAASRPFSTDRDGFVMGEGAAVLILESLEHAKARGAKILGKLAGFGQTADAYHLTSPSGEGAQRAMKLALADAGLEAGDIGYVNAHATSTPAGDEVEAAGIAAVVAANTPVSSTKSATGHLLGAAGALEAAFCAQALLDKQLPATRNLQTIDPACAVVEHLTQVAAAPQLKACLSNSFGFGGTNAALVLTVA
jgi:3-oxoacyl-[acyl-carrier-protein] synthase II